MRSNSISLLVKLRILSFWNILFLLFVNCVGKEEERRGLSALLPLSGSLLKVGIIGDSLSQRSDGFGLREKLGNRFTVTDYSVSGRDVPGWAQEVGVALTGEHDLWIVELGTNDVSGYPIERFPDNYEFLLNEIRSKSNGVIMPTVLPPTIQPGYREKILNVNSYLRSLGAAYPVADMETVFLQVEDSIPLYPQTDPIHPNPVGYDLMGTIYADSIRKLYIH